MTIDFDVDPDGAPIADGTVIDTLYSSQGVTFSRADGTGQPDCLDTNIFARGSNRSTSSPNVVSICETKPFPSFNENWGFVRGTLSRRAVELCIAVEPDGSSGRAVLDILDLDDNVLDSVSSSAGDAETLCIQGVDIRFFRFAGDGSWAFIDDLRITYSANRIDFDTTADGTPIASGSEVDTLFVSEGVVFEWAPGVAPCGSGAVYANDDLPTGFGSPPNAVSVCPNSPSDFSQFQEGLVRARFPRRVNHVCVDVLPTDPGNQAVIRGFDVDGQKIAETLSPADGTPARICVTNSLMRSVEFAGYGEKNDYARFDNLDYTFGAAVIDFDVDTDDEPLAGGTVVNTTYQGAGVVLTGERLAPNVCGSGTDVYANDDLTGDFASSPNQVSLCPSGFSDFSESNDGMIAASFPIDALSVCIDVRATQADDYAVLRSFAGNGDELLEVESSGGATETLCLAGTAIRKVRFAGAGSKYVRFDNLDVTFSPEPASGILGIVSLLAVAGLSRRSRRAQAR